MQQREPWRHEAEVACLKSGQVRISPAVAQMPSISGPGMCGADFPLKVASLGDGAPMAFADELRPPANVPGFSPRPAASPYGYPQPAGRYPSSYPAQGNAYPAGAAEPGAPPGDGVATSGGLRMVRRRATGDDPSSLRAMAIGVPPLRGK